MQLQVYTPYRAGNERRHENCYIKLVCVKGELGQKFSIFAGRRRRRG